MQICERGTFFLIDPERSARVEAETDLVMVMIARDVLRDKRSTPREIKQARKWLREIDRRV